MTLTELKEVIDRALENNALYGGGRELEAVIVVKTAGSIGGAPGVGVKSAPAGFDWDSGKLLIHPDRDLRVIEADELAAIRKASAKEGWAEYENRGLKAEIKRLKAQIGRMEAAAELSKNLDKK